MAALSDYAEKLVLDWLLTTGAATRPTTWYVALYTSAPNDAGGGTEVSGFGYARQAVTFGAGSSPGGTSSNTGIISFTAAGGSFGTVTHIAILDASSAGNFIASGELTVSKVVSDGDSLAFDTATLIITIA
jgi:hypothetical protein